MKLILHIGAHKTGTTALQYFLYAHKKAMTPRGITYPEVCFHHYAQHRLAFALKGWRDPNTWEKLSFEEEIQAFRTHVETHCLGKDVIISSEEFFSVTPEKIKELKEALEKIDIFKEIHIILFLRRPDDLFISIYNQMAKDPGNNFYRDIEEFINHPQSLDPEMFLCRNIKIWIESFGKRNIHINFVEKENPVHYFMRFLTEYGLEIDKNWKSYRDNISVTYPVIEVMKFAKRNKMKIECRKKLYDISIKMFKNDQRIEIGREARMAIVRKYENCLAALFRELGLENPYTAEKLSFPKENGNFQETNEKYLAKIMEKLLINSQ